MSVPTSERRAIRPVGHLTASPAIGRIRLEWEHEPYEPFVDHYAVHGAQSGNVPIDQETLLGTTIYPRFALTHLGGQRQHWRFRVVALDAAGNRSRPSSIVEASSRESVAVSGQPLATIGSFDQQSLELALAPDGYAEYEEHFPHGPDFTIGEHDPATDWSYIHPGPQDGWAGSRTHRATVRFRLDQVPETEPWLSIWLIDTHRTLPGTAVLSMNDIELETVEFEGGATRGSLEGDATDPSSGLVPSYVELALPRRSLQTGQNVLIIDKQAGSWHAYDALGLFVPADSRA